MLRVRTGKRELIFCIKRGIENPTQYLETVVVLNIINAYGNDILEYALTISKVFYTGKYEENSSKHGAMQWNGISKANSKITFSLIKLEKQTFKRKCCPKFY